MMATGPELQAKQGDRLSHVVIPERDGNYWSSTAMAREHSGQAAKCRDGQTARHT